MTAATEPVLIDVRQMPPAERHATIFAALEGLEPGATFVVVNDHAPAPLVRHLATAWPDRFETRFLREGPEVWQLAITRKAT